MCEQRVRRVLIIILCLVLLRGLIYSLLIPFDQSPDEKHHFKLIKAKHLQLNHATEEERQHTAAQLEMVFRYLASPEKLSQKYLAQDFARAKLPDAPSSWQLSYLINGWVLKLLALENVRDEIYVLRGLSILCGVFIVFCAFLVVRELVPDNEFLIIGVPTLITFIPQFSAMNGAITNDKFAEVFVALMFWIMVKIFKNGMQGGYVVAYMLSMGLAILSKRTTIFALPVFLVALLVYFWKGSLGLRFHLILIVVFIGITLGMNALAWYVDEIRKSTDSKVILFLREYMIWLSPYTIRYFFQSLFSLESLLYYAKFFTVMYWSFWGIFGYMTIHLHHFWYLLAALSQFLAGCGLAKLVWRVKRKTTLYAPWQVKILYLFGLSVLLAVMLPFLRFIVVRGQNPMLPQGRYLFPVLIPIGIFTLLGLEQLIASRYHRLIGAIGLLGLLLLDIVSLSNYILLNFHRMALF
jgi:hypothetical protein